MRAVRSEVAVIALAIDAEDAAGESFYVHQGFVALHARRDKTRTLKQELTTGTIRSA